MSQIVDPARNAWYMISSMHSVLPEPSVPDSSVAGARLVRDASVGSKSTGWRAPESVWPMYGPGVGADGVRRRRDHRAELLDGQVVVVVGNRACLAGQVGDEQPQLLAERAVQLDHAVLAPQARDPLLEHARGVGAPTASEIVARSSGGRSPPVRYSSSSRAACGRSAEAALGPCSPYVSSP